MKFTAVLAFLAFATTTIALPAEAVEAADVPIFCSNGCEADRFGRCTLRCPP
ncbi:hypothetical protein Vi05172_g2014 [Venturia inaequalis]|nr:hypothetical protein Vi05172_g2014 [Venturia inaequalis]